MLTQYSQLRRLFVVDLEVECLLGNNVRLRWRFHIFDVQICDDVFHFGVTESGFDGFRDVVEAF